MSNSKDQAMWGIHGGQTGNADTLFLKHNVIALRWEAMSNLSVLC
jgi:restriction system protein